jgi:hypothetical protein
MSNRAMRNAWAKLDGCEKSELARYMHEAQHARVMQRIVRACASLGVVLVVAGAISLLATCEPTLWHKVDVADRSRPRDYRTRYIQNDQADG